MVKHGPKGARLLPLTEWIKLGALLTGLALAALTGLAAEPSGPKRVGAKPVGSIVGWGAFEVDHLPAPPDTTLFAGDVILTGAASGAIVRLLSGDSVTVAENTDVAVPSQSSGRAPATLQLRRGGLVVRSAAGKSSEITVPGATLTLNGETRSPAICRIAALGSSAAVVAERGRVVIHGPGVPLVLVAGNALRLQDGVPQDTGQAAKVMTAREIGEATRRSAGRVTQLFPEEAVEHAGSRVAVPLRLNELVSQGDGIRTSASGRVRIQLLDGSLVALGADTSMKLIRHDPDTQQTQIELAYGRLRAEVVQPRQPQGGFEVRTATAAVKAAATSFVLDAGTKLTRVCDAGDGPLSVRSVNPSLSGEVMLHKGECVGVRHDSAPGQAQQAEAEVGREMALAGFEGVPTIEHTAKIVAIHEATTSTDALAAILAGIGYGVIDSAVNQIQDTSSNLQKAASQFGAAAAAANSAAAAANAVNPVTAALCAAIEATAQFDGLPVSPSGPGGFNCPQ